MLFVDQLRYEVSGLTGLAVQRQENSEGNTIEQRVLADGRSYNMVKNFPVKQELIPSLLGLAENIEYIERPEEKHWELTYNSKQ